MSRESDVRSIFGCTGLALALAIACGPMEPADPRPNVLLITIDTLRADRLGSYGFDLDTSPNIDRLASQGVLFERAIAASSATVPSHASIMTSRYPREHTVGYLNGASRLEGDKTLAEVFAKAGYATAAFVGNAVLSHRVGLDRGFDVYDDELTQAEASRARYFERDADTTTERALAWLDREVERPWFVWVHYQDPHGPYSPPAEYANRFAVRGPPDEPELPILSGNTGWGGIPAYQKLEGLTKPSEYESRYADEIFYADQAIGRLLAATDSHDSGRPAIVLLTSDHGERLGENDRYFVHGFTTTPPVARVPLILRAPGLAPTRRSEVVSHVDIMPTLLDLAGLETPDGSSGLSLARTRSGTITERFVYCDVGPELSAYRRDEFVRMFGVGDAWSPSNSDRDREGALWISNRWLPDGSWERQPELDELDPAIQRYSQDAVAVKPLTQLSPAYRKSLEALGYAIE